MAGIIVSRSRRAGAGQDGNAPRTSTSAGRGAEPIEADRSARRSASGRSTGGADTPDPPVLDLLESAEALEAAGATQAAAIVRAAMREAHHDLRQPIAAIRALVAAAEAQPGVPPVVASYLHRIEEQTAQMVRVCRQVLERVEERRVTAVEQVAADAAQGCREATGCAIELDVEPVSVLIDRDRLRRAIANLLENAARAAGPGGRLRVTVRREGDHVRVSVGDSGPGFGAGPRGASSLGLGLVNRLACDHGGRVEIGTSDLGGALVTLVLSTPVITL